MKGNYRKKRTIEWRGNWKATYKRKERTYGVFSYVQTIQIQMSNSKELRKKKNKLERQGKKLLKETENNHSLVIFTFQFLL